jgi:hypothetical protein
MKQGNCADRLVADNVVALSRMYGRLALTRFGLQAIERQRKLTMRVFLNLRHPHRKAVDHHVGVERFENILREQAMVDARVFVFLELRQLVLSYVNHR